MKRGVDRQIPFGETVLPPVAVVQPLPGIGDMVWHLPHIRAIAAMSGAPVTLLAKPRSLAGQLFAGEPAVEAILPLDLNPAGRRGTHDGVIGLVRLSRLMRDGRFGTIILLHHSVSIAAAAWLAGIPHRLGYGWGRQRLFLNTGPSLPRDVARLHQHTRATRFLGAAGIPLPSAEPTLPVTAAARAQARLRLGPAQVSVCRGGYRQQRTVAPVGRRTLRRTDRRAAGCGLAADRSVGRPGGYGNGRRHPRPGWAAERRG